MVGTVGRVSGRIGPGLTGEVLLPVRGGVEGFLAHPALPHETFEVGTQVVVVDYLAPNTVYVSGTAL
ncbi:MAG TPA: hypothetical protein VFS29_10330 [Motilibacteraceae bacterium]|nr:hypothetical protein [Motilibacteraceae bacterium]